MRIWSAQQQTIYTSQRCQFPSTRTHDLQFIEEFKNSLPPTTPETLIKIHEFNLLMFEEDALERKERMRIINCILLQQPVFYKRDMLKRLQFQVSNNTRDFLLLGLLRKI